MLVGALGAVLAAVGPVIAIFAGAVAAGMLLYKNWDTIKAKAGELKENVTQKFSELKTGVTNSIENTKQIALNKFEGLKSSAINKAEQIKSKVSSSFESLKSNATSAFENLKSDVSGKVEDVWSKVSGVADRLKGVFNFSWSLPRPKLPHITWSWNNIGGIVSVPSFGIDWYKKAYDNPIMFTRPTVLQTPSGLKGFGDGNGGEVVLSEAKLRQMSGDHNYTVNVYGAEGQSVDALAQAVQSKFVQWQKQEESVYA
jgi:phage-related minor tail protein